MPLVSCASCKRYCACHEDLSPALSRVLEMLDKLDATVNEQQSLVDEVRLGNFPFEYASLDSTENTKCSNVSPECVDGRLSAKEGYPALVSK